MAPVQSTGPYTAVVTGASGFVASEVVKELLIKGWNVRGTVRSLSKKEKVAHLEALGKVCSLAICLGLFHCQILQKFSHKSITYDVLLHPQALPGKLTLHEADLLKKGSFDEVVKVGLASLKPLRKLCFKFCCCTAGREE